MGKYGGDINELKLGITTSIKRLVRAMPAGPAVVKI